MTNQDDFTIEHEITEIDESIDFMIDGYGDLSAFANLKSMLSKECSCYNHKLTNLEKVFVESMLTQISGFILAKDKLSRVMEVASFSTYVANTLKRKDST